MHGNWRTDEEREALEVAIIAHEEQPKIGHWVWKTDVIAPNNIFRYCECSECGQGMEKYERSYCLKCGAKME